MIDLLQIADAADPARVRELREDLARASGTPARLLGRDAAGVVQSGIRRTTRVAVPAETRERVLQLFLGHREQVEAHFGLALGDCEEPQFLRYQAGDFFVAHQDGNTPLIYDQSRLRRVSMVLFLSTHSPEPAPDTYGGGALVFHGPSSEPALRVPVTPPAGTLVAFPSETTHEVTPVTHGERYTLVSWFRARGS